jgi:SAM-dependent methyltransferase
MDSASCPLCNSRDSSILFEVKTAHSTFYIVQCRQCNLARTFPFPGDDILNIHNKAQYYGRRESKFVPIFQNIRGRLSKSRARKYLSMIPTSIQRPKVLDIGCSEGRLLSSFLEYGCDCYGIEHTSYPERRFLNRDRIQYFYGDLENLDLEERSFDIIILWHVLEHMDNPKAVIGRAHGLLAPDGILVLAVPNFSSVEARYFKGLWFHLDIPWHKFHFSEKSLNYLIKNRHLQIIQKSTFCLEQGVYGINQSILNYMGWPRNEMYEAMKGNILKGRELNLVAQSIISAFLLLPCVFILLITSIMKKGSVLKIVLKKS